MKLNIFCYCVTFILASVFCNTLHQSDQTVNDGPVVTSGVQILKWDAISYIQSRMATTYITSKLKNHDRVSREFAFSALLPDGAYISNFTMEVNGQLTLGQVKEASAAKEAYEKHQNLKGTAGLIVKGARETNYFEIFINLQPNTEAHVKLTYEEVLERVHGVYKHIIYVHPGQIVPDLKIRVELVENVEISDLRVPQFGQNYGDMENGDLLDETETKKIFSDATVEVKDEENSYKRIIRYQPGIAEQQSLNNETGHFVVLYDVKRDDSDSKAFQVVDGWFVHFYTPRRVRRDVLNKHVVFVLDISGSMEGIKIAQTRDAMKEILKQLDEKDYFNLITFSSTVYQWKPAFVAATGANVKSAIRHVEEFDAHGGTNIDGAMKQALRLLATAQTSSRVSMIIFMTDGESTWGETNKDKIVKNIQMENIGDRSKVAIHTMAFGREADFNLMKKIAMNNNGIARRIYEGPDADLQLKGVYKQISLPLLTNVVIEYLNASVEVDSIVKDASPISYLGKEHVVAGKLKKRHTDSVNEQIKATVTGKGKSGQIESKNEVKPVSVKELSQQSLPKDPFVPRPTKFGGFVERMWAYKTIKQLLENAKYIEQDKSKQAELKSRALNLSLHYNFVTDLTSMVVIVNQVILPMKDRKPHKRVQPRMQSSSHGGETHSWPIDGKKELVQISSAEAECQDDNEDWKPCGTMCQATCTNPGCTLTNCSDPAACGCKDGYVRHEGRCILSTNCPNYACKANQELNNCYVSKFLDGTSTVVECKDTCTENGQDEADCELQCWPEKKCVCKRGFVSDGHDNCIARSSCP